MAKEETVIQNGDSADSAAKTQRIKPKKILPTDRIAFSKQLDILRAFAIASGSEKKAVTTEDVAAIVKHMTAATIGLSNAFFVDSGLLARSEGKYVPSEDAFAFSRAYDWEAESAPSKLGPAIEKTWFAQALLPRAKFRDMEEKEAIQTLADAAEADKSYRNQLRMLLEYLEAANLILRDGNTLRTGTRLATIKVQTGSLNINSREPLLPRRDENIPPSSGAPSSMGGVQFNINVKVDMAEMSGWPSDRIKTFMEGLAAVIAAKGKAEESQ